VPHGNSPVPAANPPDQSLLDSDAWLQLHDYPLEDVSYNTDGQLVGATFRALVEKLTPHNASIVDSTFSSIFFLTFRLFSSPAQLVQAIIDRYNLVPPPGLSEERTYVWQQRKGIPVRLRISNLIKSWLELHWRPATDNAVLQPLLDFNRDALSLMFPGPSHRIHEIILTRKREGSQAAPPPTPRLDLARDPLMTFTRIIPSPFEVPRPIMTRTLFSHLRNRSFTSISVTEFDSLELARQLTIMESKVFCAIQSEEILEGGQEGSKPPVNVRAVTSLSTVITGWVAESILNEVDIKKRTVLVKFFIKLADVGLRSSWPFTYWASALTFFGVALHDIAQLCDVTLYTRSARLVDHCSPATNVDGEFITLFLPVVTITNDRFDLVGCTPETEASA